MVSREHLRASSHSCTCHQSASYVPDRGMVWSDVLYP